MFPSPGGAHSSTDELFAGRYDIDGQLPWGGRASYYRAASEGTPLIICVLPIDLTRSTRAEAGFSTLVQRLGRARARSLPRVLDAGAVDGVPYIAFHDTRGRLLREVLRDRTLPSSTVLRVARGVLSALEAAHEQGIVHGDLTPQNIIITRESDGNTGARVVGTGIVPFLRVHPEASAHAAHTGSGEHAIAYMAPELIGTNAVPASADLYAVGTLLHHMVRGAPPVGWESDEGFEDVPGLRDVIRRAMARHPDARYPNAAGMLSALEWLEVESSQLNPQTQDIAPWMESSTVGSYPVPALASTRPPAHASSLHPAGTVLSVSGARPRPNPPRAPLIIEHQGVDTRRYWLQIAVLLAVLGIMVVAAHWWTRQSGASPEATPAAEYVD
ncbi:MAG: protein kinase [Polyangiales bacterium]